jgi:hypothetical protein
VITFICDDSKSTLILAITKWLSKSLLQRLAKLQQSWDMQQAMQSRHQRLCPSARHPLFSPQSLLPALPHRHEFSTAVLVRELWMCDSIHIKAFCKLEFKCFSVLCNDIFKFWIFGLLFDSAVFEGGETRITEYPWTD